MVSLTGTLVKKFLTLTDAMVSLLGIYVFNICISSTVDLILYLLDMYGVIDWLSVLVSRQELEFGI